MLPAMTLAEALETTRIHRVAGLTGAGTAVVTTRPFRAPHHTISDVGLIGGGQVPMPGEVSRAHHGVRFLDELTLLVKSKTRVKVVWQTMKASETGPIPLEKPTSIALEIGLRDLTNRV
jgi:hypothetical protein